MCVVLFFFGQLLALPLLSVKCFSSPAVLLLVFRGGPPSYNLSAGVASLV